ncbi:MAG TPA: GGDEF domain-containing protein [Kineosporiaceae bacterium]|nr:GGDEF domain-containing protein [Kineosporiaceae bacterium]
MADVPRAQRAAPFATRLGVAVLLAACLAAAGVAVLADRLAAAAVRRETVARVTSDAAGVTTELARTGPAATGTGPESATGTQPQAERDARLRTRLADVLASLSAEPEVLSVLVVDGRGSLLYQGPEGKGTGPPGTGGIDGRRLIRVARGDGPLVQDGPAARTLTVGVPLRLPDRTAALAVTLDDRAAGERAGQLWRALGVALMLGAGATTGLVFLTGGRRLVRRHDRALWAAATDDLTGLGSRRAFRRDLRIQVEHARRNDLPLTLALLDLNGLETVNATVGRRRGDALVLAAATALHRLTGSGWAAYRIGGDAFALIMPVISQDDAFTATDGLRRQLGVDAAPLTANVGLAVLDPLRCPDPETLVIAADAALFEARCLGGNRVVGAGDGGTGLRWVATSGAHDRLP